MIKPTIGRVMWFWPVATERGMQPLAAMVAYVHSDNMVNLSVLSTDGVPFPAGSVAIVQDGSPYVAGDLPYAEWMPYQKGLQRAEGGDAAKTEALEAKAEQANNDMPPPPPNVLTENDPSVPAQSPLADPALPAAGSSTL